MAVTVTVQETPNPAARRFLVDKPVQDESRGRFYKDPEQTDDPLASELLGMDGVDGVMFLPTSVTVNKTDAASWEELEPRVRETLDAHFG